jgi:hypothetical protein
MENTGNNEHKFRKKALLRYGAALSVPEVPLLQESDSYVY